MALYRKLDGETVNWYQLDSGDRFALRISWYDWDESKPTAFTVLDPMSDTDKEMAREGHTPMSSVKAEGDDGHTYRIYYDNLHVECLTDDKDGYDRGTKASKPKLIE